MSIVRVGILVALVVAVLPANKEQQARLYDRTVSAVHWTSTFCDRNGATCTQAKDLWSSFLSKAQFGAMTAYDLAVRYTKGEDGYQGTLTREDLEPAWRGADSGV